MYGNVIGKTFQTDLTVSKVKKLLSLKVDTYFLCGVAQAVLKMQTYIITSNLARDALDN